MEMTQEMAPLAGLGGEVPPAPQWFTDNLAVPHESFSVTVDGARLECRAWGERGKPGLVFVHGNAAHLGWWSFLAPFFSADHRVVTWSLSGMGRSDWRERYTIDTYVTELWAVAEAGGACDEGPPVVIGHSLGGQPVLLSAARHAERMRAAILVDCGFPGRHMPVMPVAKGRSYPDVVTALTKFRLSPQQPCENLYIADFLARMGLKQLDDGTFAYGFDRGVWRRMELTDLWQALAECRAPLAVVRGALSGMTVGETSARLCRAAAAGTPFIDIPEAHHHVQIDQPLALVAALRTLLEAWA